MAKNGVAFEVKLIGAEKAKGKINELRLLITEIQVLISALKVEIAEIESTKTEV